MNRQDTARVLAILRTIWPTTVVDDNTVTAYHMALGSEDYEAVNAAVGQWLRTGKFFPRPSELLEIIAVDRVAPDLVPEAAWDEVIRQAGQVGVHGTPAFSNPLIGKAVAAIGWRELCLTDEKHYGTLRAQFRDVLIALRNRAVRQEQVGGVAMPVLDRPSVRALREVEQ